MARPALYGTAADFRLGYLPAGELKQQCDAMCRFGVDHTVLLKLAKQITGPRSTQPVTTTIGRNNSWHYKPAGSPSWTVT
jgi:hypothetical protein